jgi:hypothetical protein
MEAGITRIKVLFFVWEINYTKLVLHIGLGPNRIWSSYYGEVQFGLSCGASSVCLEYKMVMDIEVIYFILIDP